MTKIELWQDSVVKTVIAARKSQRLLKEAEANFEMPINLRPATSEDIRPGNIIWYPVTENSDPFWQSVTQILAGGTDDFKAYEAHDGCRYGLHNAYIEVTHESH